MAIVVQTVTTCDVCGFETVRPGPESDCPPVAWSELVIRTRLPGRGWENIERPFDGFVCSICTNRIVDMIRALQAPRVRAVREDAE